MPYISRGNLSQILEDYDEALQAIGDTGRTENSNGPKYFTEKDIKDFQGPIQETAKRVAAQNPSPRKVRPSGVIKGDIFKLVGEKKHSKHGDEGILPCFKRRLADAQEQMKELRRCLDKLERRAEFLKSEPGLPARGVLGELRELEGYSYKAVRSSWPKALSEQEAFMPGSITLVLEEIAGLERRIDTLQKAVVNTEARVNRELPALEWELKESLRIENALRAG